MLSTKFIKAISVFQTYLVIHFIYLKKTFINRNYNYIILYIQNCTCQAMEAERLIAIKLVVLIIYFLAERITCHCHPYIDTTNGAKTMVNK